jgi:hypothetical protein
MFACAAKLVSRSPEVNLRAEELAPHAKGGLDGLLWVFDQNDSSDHWNDFLAKAHELGAKPRIAPKFNRAEVSDAEWCLWVPQWHHGYPQPEEGCGYRNITYDLSRACPVCDVGFRQAAPFRMRTEPRWGRRAILQMFWVYDVWFVTPEAYRSVFQPFGIASREVLRKSGRPLETVVQLVVEEAVPIDEYRTEGELCAACGVFKLHAAVNSFAPRPAVTPSGPLAQSQGWYGSGGSAFRETLLRRDLVSAIQDAGIRGTLFYPCRT